MVIESSEEVRPVTDQAIDTRPVALHRDVWELIDDEATRSGLTRDDVLEQNIRRTLAGNRLKEFLNRVGGRTGLSPEEADQIASEELAAVRREKAERQPR